MGNMYNDNDQIDSLGIILNAVVPIAAKLRKGEETTGQCPRCGKTMRVSKSGSNGHVWAVCEQCGVLICS